MKKMVRYIFLFKKYSLFKSLYYTFFCKHIAIHGKSIVLIDRKSKIHFKKGSMIILNHTRLVVEKSIIDFMIPSNIYMSNNSTWTLTGNAVIVGTSISVWDYGELVTGNGFVVNPLTRIMVEKKITFGNNNIIARNCYFNDSNSHTIFKKGHEIVRQKDILFGNNVWICANSTVLKGVNVGNNVVIGASSLVTKNIESNSVYYNKRNECIIDDIKWKL